MSNPQYKTATFAGGCFWCMQPPFDNLDGVISTEVGYTGGDVVNPTYEQVCSGSTGHYEAIRVTYDPAIVSFETLLNTFWHNVDPTQGDGQFADRGPQYRTAIFYHDEGQQREAEASKAALQESKKFDRAIATEILKAEKFFQAENYHQGYYLKNSGHYQMYKQGSGRAGFIERTWSGQDEE